MGLAALALTAGAMLVAAPGTAQAAERADSAPSQVSAQDVGVQDVGVLVDQRPCNVGQSPPQIRIFLMSGHLRCYGGTVGSMSLGSINVESIAAGGYWGFLYCTPGSPGGTFAFRPGRVETLNWTRCHTLQITPPRV